MKKLLFLSLFVSFKMFGQSVELKPGSNGFVMIPNVSSLGTCLSADKGKIVYLSTDNTLRMCNGGSWVNLSIGSFYMPYYYSGISVSSLFHLENTSTTTYNSTIHSITNSDAEIGAVTGVSQKFLPTQNISGLRGINWSSNSNGYGVYGEHSGSGSGVYGIAEYGYGVYGKTNGGTGIYGYSTTGNAAQFTSVLGGYALRTNGKIELGGLIGAGTNKFLKSTNLAGNADWSDLFPYSFSKFSTEPLLTLTNTHTGNYDAAVFQTNTEASYSGVVGRATNISPNSNSKGLTGENLSTNSLGSGVYGYHAGTGSGVWGYSGSGKGVRGNSDGGIGGYFYSNNFALITDKGKVGFGNTTPSLNIDERVEINGRLRIRDSTSSAGVWFNNSANSISYLDGAFHGMKTNTETGIFIGGYWHFWINSAGNATLTGILTQSSDRRLKKDFSTLNNSLSSIYNLNGYHYKWTEESRSKDLQTGLIAQEVQKIFPELVQTDEKGFLSVNYIGLVPHLIEAVKELRDENNSLKLNNQTLENKNQTLESRLDKIEAMLSTMQPNTEILNSKK